MLMGCSGILVQSRARNKARWEVDGVLPMERVHKLNSFPSQVMCWEGVREGLGEMMR